MKRAWTGEPVELESPRFAARGNTMLPRPASLPHPPIELLRAEQEARARTGLLDICLTPFSHPHHPRGQERLDPPQLREEIAELEPLGVTWLSIKLRAPDHKTLLQNIERFGREVIRDPSGG
jgi:alkanesulfonate monooxygenase SsuD/methylene tetrahydromethanopterin reductase-like flavin-dependent oxidoreductase (luciferase family)